MINAAGKHNYFKVFLTVIFLTTFCTRTLLTKKNPGQKSFVVCKKFPRSKDKNFFFNKLTIAKLGAKIIASLGFGGVLLILDHNFSILKPFDFTHKKNTSSFQQTKSIPVLTAEQGTNTEEQRPEPPSARAVPDGQNSQTPVGPTRELSLAEPQSGDPVPPDVNTLTLEVPPVEQPRVVIPSPSPEPRTDIWIERGVIIIEKPNKQPTISETAALRRDSMANLRVNEASINQEGTDSRGILHQGRSSSFNFHQMNLLQVLNFFSLWEEYKFEVNPNKSAALEKLLKLQKTESLIEILGLRIDFDVVIDSFEKAKTILIDFSELIISLNSSGDANSTNLIMDLLAPFFLRVKTSYDPNFSGVKDASLFIEVIEIYKLIPRSS